MSAIAAQRAMLTFRRILKILSQTVKNVKNKDQS